MALHRHCGTPSDIESCARTDHFFYPMTAATLWSAPPAPEPPMPTRAPLPLPPRPPKSLRVYPEYTPPPNPVEVHLNMPMGV